MLSNKKNPVGLLLAGIVVVLLMSACSNNNIPDRYQGKADSEVVSMRTQERWAAMIGRDWKGVYQFASPSYRRAYDFTHFSNQYGSQIKRKSVDVVSVEIAESDPTVARVVVRLHYVTSGFGGSPDLELSSAIKETWVKEDGMWWFAEPK